MTDSIPDFEQQRIADHADHLRLVAIAKARHSDVWWWWGIRGGGSGDGRCRAECFVCDAWITSVDMRDEHRAMHLAELDQGGGQQ